MESFRKVKFEVYRHSGRNGMRYVIRSNYRGIEISAYTNDSEIIDWWNDDSDKEKHMDAKRSCYYHIISEYNRIKEY